MHKRRGVTIPFKARFHKLCVLVRVSVYLLFLSFDGSPLLLQLHPELNHLRGDEVGRVSGGMSSRGGRRDWQRRRRDLEKTDLC